MFGRLTGTSRTVKPGTSMWTADSAASAIAPRPKKLSSVLFTNWVGICGNGFLVQTRRERRAYPSAVCKERTTKSEPKRHAARRVAPHLAFDFVAPRPPLRRGARVQSSAFRSRGPPDPANRKTDERARTSRTSRNRGCDKLESFSSVVLLARLAPICSFKRRQRKRQAKVPANIMFVAR